MLVDGSTCDSFQLRVNEWVRQSNASKNLALDIKSILDDVVGDLSSLSDETLLLPLIVPEDYAPTVKAHEWLSAMLPVELGLALGITSSVWQMIWIFSKKKNRLRGRCWSAGS